MINNEKYEALQAYLRGLGRVMLAFSGGVDSTFLLRVGRDVLGENFKAVTIQSPYIPKWEIQEARQIARELGVAFEIIEAPIIDTIRSNPENRCYLCKKAVFSLIGAAAARDGFPQVIDGTNFDDIGDYRPGLKALQELAVKSPLLDCGLTKQEIRNFSKELSLPTWDKPSYACLLTRIPYGNVLREEDFVKIEQAERFLMERGFRAVRVRCHDNLARIELGPADRERFFAAGLPAATAEAFKAFGFSYVTMDLEGYRTGSFNADIGKA